MSKRELIWRFKLYCLKACSDACGSPIVEKGGRFLF